MAAERTRDLRRTRDPPRPHCEPSDAANDGRRSLTPSDCLAEFAWRDHYGTWSAIRFPQITSVEMMGTGSNPRGTERHDRCLGSI